jgi:hypothetical protein
MCCHCGTGNQVLFEFSGLGALKIHAQLIFGARPARVVSAEGSSARRRSKRQALVDFWASLRIA